MTATRSKRSDEELVNVSEHLWYEIQMLFVTAREIQTLPAGNIRNALIESFAVHARNLLDFLYATQPQSDDVIAEDFFDGGKTWLERRPKKSELLATAHKRANKEIAHLTYTRLRVTDEDKPWPYVDIANHIATVLNKFLSVVPDHRVSSSFQQAVSSILQAQNCVGTRSTAYTSL